MKNSQLLKYLEKYRDWFDFEEDFLLPDKIHKYYAIKTNHAFFSPSETLKIEDDNDIDKVIYTSSKSVDKYMFLYSKEDLEQKPRNARALLVKLLSVNDVTESSLKITYEVLSIVRVTSIIYNEDNSDITYLRGKVILPDQIFEDDKEDESYDDRFRFFIQKVKDISKRAAELSANTIIKPDDVLNLTTFVMSIMKEVDQDHNIIINNYVLFILMSWVARFVELHKKQIEPDLSKKVETLLFDLAFKARWSFMVLFAYLSTIFDILKTAFDYLEKVKDPQQQMMNDVEKKIEAKLKSDLDKQQTDFILREKLRVIKSLLSSESEKKQEQEFKQKDKYPKKVLEIIQEQKQKQEENCI